MVYYSYYSNLKATASLMQHAVDDNDYWNSFIFLVAPSVYLSKANLLLLTPLLVDLRQGGRPFQTRSCC